MLGKVVFGTKSRKFSTIRNTSQPARRTRPLSFDNLEDRSVPSAVSFLKVDAGTEGSWQGTYGHDGETIAGATPTNASYAQVTFNRSHAKIWDSGTTDLRALQNPTGGGRIASYWQGFSYSLDVNLTDGQQHQLALYALDWTRAGRSDQIVATDADTGAQLDTRALSDFGNGKYLVYNVTGHVKFTVTALSGSSALLSGVFFDPVAAATSPPPASPPVNSTTNPPTGTFGSSGPVGEGGSASVQFTGVSDPLGQAMTYSFDFGNDGTFDVTGSTSATATVPSSYLADGPMSVAVRGRITAADGRYSDYTTTLQVTNVAPTPAIAGPFGTTPGSSASFTASATDPSAADTAAGFTYAWNFGDGSTAAGSSATHTYAAAGTYTLTLTATDKDGGVGSLSRTFSVATPSASGVTVTPDWIITPYDNIPNFGGHPTRTAAQSGAWSDPNTWGGTLPTTGDVVSIPSGVTVTYDQLSDVKYDTVAIQAGGTLQFQTDVTTRLRVTNLLVMEGGTLTVGTAANPVAAGVKAEIVINDLPIDTTKDPEQYGHGLIALGTVTMHGAAMSDTYVKLAVEPKAGDTTLTLATPVTGWHIGDRLVLPDTQQMLPGVTDQPELERPTVAGISADGLTITLTQPLQYDHLGARDRNGALTFRPYVGDLTRNVALHSESMTGTRGYTFFTMRANVDIEYAQFSGLGRTTNDVFDNTTYDANGNVTHVGTNEMGRYPVFFDHLIGPTNPQPDGYQYTFVGDSVFCPLDPMPFRWGIAIQDSHYGRVADNVLYNWAGAGIMTVTGNETGNVIEKNFVTHITGTDDRGDGRAFRAIPEFGFEGTGIWLRSGTNYVRNNVVSDTTEYGYQIMPVYAGTVIAPAFQGADPRVPGQGVSMDPQKTPVLEFSGNEAFSMNTGLDIWAVGADTTVTFNIAQSTIENYRAWNTVRGFFAYPMNNFLLNDWVIRGTLFGNINETQGIAFGDYLSANVTINNADIQGVKVGIALPIKQGDMTSTGSTPQTMYIQNSFLANHINIQSSILGGVTGGGIYASPRLTIVRNVTFATTPLSANIDPSSPHEDIQMFYNFAANPNVIQSDKLFVYDYNGVSGDNFEVFYKEQAANFVVPQTDPSTGLVGSPEAGLTNQQNWDKYGIAIAGAVLPADAVQRSGIDGMVEKI